MKKLIKIILAILLIIVIVVGGYLAYAFKTYYRLEDNLELDVQDDTNGRILNADSGYLKLTSWNIGFAAYVQDYGFFMDGGTESRAYSEESVISNMKDITTELEDMDSDFYMIQEVDVDSTRSYHVDEKEMIRSSIFDGKYAYAFSQNYDSPYLMYPLIKPHGASKSGLITASIYEMTSSLRRSLPVQTGFAKFLDLDRCYSISRIPVIDREGNSRELVLFNFHLSAYTTDPTITSHQVEMLTEDMNAEYEKGNYVIAGGDFNMDLLGNSGEIFGISAEDYSWAQPFKEEWLPEGFSLSAPYDEENPVPTCRNADGPWNPETQFQITIDGFIVSDNIEVISCAVNDTDFLYSDHNPVSIEFNLK